MEETTMKNKNYRTNFTFMINSETHARMKYLAKQKKTTMSQILRDAIQVKLKEMESPEGDVLPMVGFEGEGSSD